jgi:predicted secreted Zn-dependent protease
MSRPVKTLLHTCLGILFLSLISPNVYATPKINTTTEYYEITGSSVKELRKQMNKFGVREQDGKRFDARTEWLVHWTYMFHRAGMVCMIGGVKATLDIKYLMPKWTNASSASEKLQEKWNRYYAALQKHEEGHAEIARQAADEIEKSLGKMRGGANCPGLGEEANKIGNAILDDYRKKEKDYDRQTKHGKTQGAVFS